MIAAILMTGEPRIVQRCGGCEAENTHPIASLRLGVCRTTSPQPNTIRLPPCPCGAQEFLMRVWDEMPANQDSRHRRLVNGLATYLKTQGFITPGCEATLAAEQAAPPQTAVLAVDVDLRIE